MKSTKSNTLVQAKHAGSSDPAVDAIFSAYPKPLKAKLLALRRLILETAAATRGVGELQETLKWGQPSISPRPRKAAARFELIR